MAIDMAYNLKADWNQLKKATTQLMNEKRYSTSCQIWNNDMTKLVNNYKQEEAAWYNSPQVTENAARTDIVSVRASGLDHIVFSRRFFPRI